MLINRLLIKKEIRGESHIDFRMQYVITTQTRWPLTPCHMRHWQNFAKIDSFLKPFLNICILGNLIVGWGEWVIKEGAGILHQIYRFSGGVNTWEGRIHQSKGWYCLGHSQTSKAEIVFGYKSLTLFVKTSNVNVWLVAYDTFKKHFLCFVNEDFASWKIKHIISTPACLGLLFQEKM